MAKLRKANPKKNAEAVGKYRKANPEKARNQRKISMVKLRKVRGEEDRLYKFRQATLYGPIFVCVSCHQRTNRSNVQAFNENCRAKIAKKIPLERCMYEQNLTSGPVMKGDDDRKPWICKTCYNSYLLKGKLP